MLLNLQFSKQQHLQLLALWAISLFIGGSEDEKTSAGSGKRRAYEFSFYVDPDSYRVSILNVFLPESSRPAKNKKSFKKWTQCLLG